MDKTTNGTAFTSLRCYPDPLRHLNTILLVRVANEEIANEVERPFNEGGLLVWEELPKGNPIYFRTAKIRASNQRLDNGSRMS